MNIFLKKAILFPVLFLLISCSDPAGNENTEISIKTTLGDIRIKLYDGTPIHRDNFIKLISSGVYDGVSFHRVIKDFMIQSGDPSTKTVSEINLPDSIKTYTIPAEFNSQYFHKKVALAAAREGNMVNPEMRSSGTQFYIVQGVRYTDQELEMAEKQINSNIKQTVYNKILKQVSDSLKNSGQIISDAAIQEFASLKMFQYLTTTNDHIITEDQRNIYKTLGGTPRLDGTYTVFGEVIEGLEIVDRISSAKTDNNDKPVTELKIIKMKIGRK